jgi:hypothetical protein
LGEIIPKGFKMNLSRQFRNLARLSTAILVAIPVMAQAPTTSSGPTLEETLEWLSNNIPTLTVNYRVHSQSASLGPSEHYGALSYEPVAMASCNIKIKSTLTYALNGQLSNGAPLHSENTSVVIYSIPLGSLSSVVQSNPLTSGLFVGAQDARYSDDRPLNATKLQGRSSVIRMEQLPGGRTSTQEWVLLMSDKDPSFIARIQKALSHAVDLCQKKEAF